MANLKAFDYETGDLSVVEGFSDAFVFPTTQSNKHTLLTHHGYSITSLAVQQGWTGRYPMREPSGSVCDDAIGTRNGTNTGGITFAAASGISETGSQGYTFNGSTGFVDLGANGYDLTTGSWAFFAVVYPTALGAVHRGLLGAPTGGVSISVLNGSLQVGVVGSSTFITGGPALSLNNFNFVGVGYDSATNIFTFFCLHPTSSWQNRYQPPTQVAGWGGSKPTPTGGVKSNYIGRMGAGDYWTGRMQEVMVRTGSKLTQAEFLTIRDDAATRTGNAAQIIVPGDGPTRKGMVKFTSLPNVAGQPNNRAEFAYAYDYATMHLTTEWRTWKFLFPSGIGWENDFGGTHTTLSQILGRNLNGASMFVEIFPTGHQSVAGPSIRFLLQAGQTSFPAATIENYNVLDPALGNGWNTHRPFTDGSGNAATRRYPQIRGPNTFLNPGSALFVYDQWMEFLVQVKYATNTPVGFVNIWTRLQGQSTWTQVYAVSGIKTVQWWGGPSNIQPATSGGSNNVERFGVYSTGVTASGLYFFHDQLSRSQSQAEAEAFFADSGGEEPPPPEEEPADPTDAYSNLILAETGLVGYWPMSDELATLWDAHSTNEGVYLGSYTHGQIPAVPGSDPATQFHGTTGYAVVTDRAALDVGDTFSLEFWFKRHSFGTTQTLFDKGPLGFNISFLTGNQLWIGAHSVGNTHRTLQTFTDTNWHHCAITKNGTDRHIYIDGAEDTVLLTNQTIQSNTGNLRFAAGHPGVINDPPIQFAFVTLEKVALYNRALAGAEVLTHYEAAFAPPAAADVLKAERGTFVANTSTGVQTINLVDTTLDVRAVRLYMVKSTSDPHNVGGYRWAQGFGTKHGGTIQQAGQYGHSVDGSSTMGVVNGMNTTWILKFETDAATGTDATATLNDIGTGSFSINWTAAPEGAYHVHYEVLGGDALTAAKVGSFQVSTAAGSQDITVHSGFGTPSVVMAFSGDSTLATFTDRTVVANNVFSLGVAKNLNDALFTSLVDVDDVADAEVRGYQDDLFLAHLAGSGSADMLLTAAVDEGWVTDGFRIIKNLEPPTARDVCYLALKGTFTSKLARTSAPIAGTPPVVVDIIASEPPRLAMVWGLNMAQTASHITSGTGWGMWHMGSTDGTREGCMGGGSYDTATVSRVTRHNTSAKTIRQFTATDPSGGTLQSEADGSFSGDNFRLSWTDIDTVARESNVLILGDSVGGGVPQAFLDQGDIYVDLQASATFLQSIVDSATVYVDVQASATEQFGASIVYTDAATALVDLQPGGTDVEITTGSVAGPPRGGLGASAIPFRLKVGSHTFGVPTFSREIGGIQSFEFSMHMNGPGSFSAQIRRDVNQTNLPPYLTDFIINIDDTDIMGGIITSVETPAVATGDMIAISGQDWLHYLDRRVYPGFDTGTPTAFTAVNTTIYSIVQSLVSMAGGFAGLSYTTSFVGNPGNTNYRIEPGDSESLLSKIQGLSELGNTFDFYVLPDRTILFGSPSFDLFPTNIAIKEDVGLLDASITYSGPEATNVFTLGAGMATNTRIWQRSQDTASTNTYRRLDAVDDIGGVPNQAAVNSQNTAALLRKIIPLVDIEVTLDTKEASMFQGLGNFLGQLRPGIRVPILLGTAEGMLLNGFYRVSSVIHRMPDVSSRMTTTIQFDAAEVF